jgi:NitT/TauT family transport system substrate-binding protein
MRKILLSICCSGAVILGAATPGTPAQQPDQWTFSLASPSFVSGLAFQWVGNHPKLRFYQSEGLEMKFVGVNGAPECVQHLLRKSVDSCVLVQDQIFLQAAQGNRLPITFPYEYTYKVTNEFGVKPDSPIQTIRDLKGKRIGVLSLAHDTYNYARLVLKGLGLDPDQQEYIAVGQGAQAVTYLYRGQIDAIVFYDIEWARMKSMGQPVRVLPQPDFIAAVKAGPVISTRSEDVQRRRDVVVHVFRGFLKSSLFAMENPEATLRMHWDLFPESKPKGVSEADALRTELSVMTARYPALDKNLAGVKYWGEFNPEGWRNYVKNLLGLDPTKVNPADFYTNDLVRDINNFDEQAHRKFAREFKY